MGIRLKDLSKLGYRDNVARSLAVAIVGKHCKHQSKEQIIKTLSDVLENPDTYKENETWGKLAERLSPTLIEKKFTAYDLLDEPLPYKTYGGKFIETLAKQQMNLAMRLPVSVAGALMPDAHAGYGLPIGGVLATDNAVIPYAVGVDIGCRMSHDGVRCQSGLSEKILASDKRGTEKLYPLRHGGRPDLCTGA